jgi:hypothetical protein
MQQRRRRLGDILDDYCTRERRITNHVVVAMIEDQVKQTRCTTCDAEHEYKQAKVPASRRRKPEDPVGDLVAAASSFARMSEASTDEPLDDDLPDALTDEGAAMAADAEETDDETLSDADLGEDGKDDGPVHRRLIRATLPRPEGQSPERKAPDFTARQPSRFDQRNGQRQRGRQASQGGQSFGQSARPGGQRHGSGRPGGNDSGGQRQQNGNRPGNAAGTGQRGGRPFGANRGSRPGGGQGRKRGR